MRRDASENRAKIITTAQKLFDSEGIASVTMADIAKSAGVGKGTLYRRFANKGELCLALMDESLRLFQNRMLDDFKPIETGESVLPVLEHFLGELVIFKLKELAYFNEIQQAAVSVDVNTPHQWQLLTLQRLLEKAVNNGESSAELDILYISHALLAAVHANTLNDLLHAGFSAERIVTGLRQLARKLLQA